LRRRIQRLPINDPRPTIPSDASELDIVEDYYIVDVDGKKERRLVSRAYCVKAPFDESLFNPYTTEAQFALYRYAKRFKNRRRYNRDLAKRRKHVAPNN
jgi:hypothetical protein